VERVLAGAVEEMPSLLHAILDSLGSLARSRGGSSESARPFDKNRNGFLAGEGATVLLLEREEPARRRGARILARVEAARGAFDPTATASDWGSGHVALGRSLAGHLEQSQRPASTIDRIVSGASGTVGGDAVEALMLREAWGGAALPPILAPKAVTGEYGGGTLAPAILALEGRPFGPTPGFETPDGRLGVVPHDGGRLDPPSRLLTASVAAGGPAAWLLLERP
jgi:3-oxoacyl-(acyl-carrier-protein) synthase